MYSLLNKVEVIILESIIKAVKRTDIGSNATKKLRKDGWVPAVLYGVNFDSMSLSLDAREITKFVKAHGSGAKLTLDLDGVQEMAIIKNLQRDVIKDNILHIEFQHLSAGQAIKIALPINFEGEDSFAKNTVLQKVAHELNIEALPKDLIDNITIDISKMEVGDVFTVADLSTSGYQGITFLDDPDTTIASLVEAKLDIEPTETEETEEAVEGAEPNTEEEAVEE